MVRGIVVFGEDAASVLSAEDEDSLHSKEGHIRRHIELLLQQVEENNCFEVAVNGYTAALAIVATEVAVIWLPPWGLGASAQSGKALSASFRPR